MSYLLLTIGSVAALAVGFAAYQSIMLENVKAKMVAEQVELAACGARLTNLIEDVRADNEIDQLPDDALTSVPNHWLRPTGD